MSAPILAIDLGKFKSTACVYRKEDGEFAVESFVSEREPLRRLLDKHRPAVVVMEACLPAGWVADCCRAAGVACKVANTASEAWKFKHTKRKTDKDDALRLAQLEALGQLPTVELPGPAVRNWRALIAYRQRLVAKRVAVQNRLRALLVGQGLTAPRGAAAWSERGLAHFRALAAPLEGCAAEDWWRGMLTLALAEFAHWEQAIRATEARLDGAATAHPSVSLLTSIPGVGVRTAEAVVAFLGDPARFRSGKEIGAYAGLVPRQYQSGETDRRGRITKRGPSLLRKLLVQCAWAMLRYNAWARATYVRLSKGGKTRRKPAVVALARRLLVVCWALLKKGERWREPAAAATAAATAAT
jgi:transposase